MKATQQSVSIGFISDRTGLSVSAIRYYDQQNLLRSDRNSGGHRRFLRSDIRRVSFIMIAQKFGFSLGEIRELLESLPDARTPTKRDWTRLSHRMRAQLDARIASLTAMRDRLDGCIGCGCLSLKACQLYNPDDEKGAEGPGPRSVL